MTTLGTVAPVVQAPPPGMGPWMRYIEAQLGAINRRSGGRVFRPSLPIAAGDQNTFVTAPPGDYPVAVLGSSSYVYTWVTPRDLPSPPDAPIISAGATVNTTEQQIGTSYTFDATEAFPASVAGVRLTDVDDLDSTASTVRTGILRLRTGRQVATDSFTNLDVTPEGFNFQNYIDGFGSEELSIGAPNGSMYLGDNHASMAFTDVNIGGHVDAASTSLGGYAGMRMRGTDGYYSTPFDGMVRDETNSINFTTYDGAPAVVGGISQFYANFGPWDLSVKTSKITAVAGGVPTSTSDTTLGFDSDGLTVGYQDPPGAVTPVLTTTSAGVDIVGNLTVTGTYPGGGGGGGGTGVAAPTGAIMLWSTLTAPTDWTVCDGSSQLRTGVYAALFAVIGTTYGAVDGVHFNLPDLRANVPVGYAAGDPDFGVLGGSQGAKEVSGAAHTHTSAAHTHTGAIHNHTGGPHTHASAAHTHPLGLGGLGWADIYHASGNTYSNRLAGVAAWTPTHLQGPVAGTVGATGPTQTFGTALDGDTNTATPGATGSAGNVLTGNNSGANTGSTTPTATGSTAPTATSVLQPSITLVYIIKL